MHKQLLKNAKQELNYYKKLQKILEKKLKSQKPEIVNSYYLKLLSKLRWVDERIALIKQLIKRLKSQARRDLIVSLKSKVKLVSIDFKIVLWLDAKNSSDLIGKRVGEIINLYNSNFQIAGIYQ